MISGVLSADSQKIWCWKFLLRCYIPHLRIQYQIIVPRSTALDKYWTSILRHAYYSLEVSTPAHWWCIRKLTLRSLRQGIASSRHCQVLPCSLYAIPCSAQVRIKFPISLTFTGVSQLLVTCTLSSLLIGGEDSLPWARVEILRWLGWFSAYTILLNSHLIGFASAVTSNTSVSMYLPFCSAFIISPSYSVSGAAMVCHGLSHGPEEWKSSCHPSCQNLKTNQEPLILKFNWQQISELQQI